MPQGKDLRYLIDLTEGAFRGLARNRGLSSLKEVNGQCIGTAY